MFKVPYAVVYDLSNFVGLILCSVGVGMIRLEYGLVVGGVLLIGLNLYNQKILKAG